MILKQSVHCRKPRASRRLRGLVSSVLLALSGVTSAHAQATDNELFELSLEELSAITIDTVALRQQSPLDSAAVVTIIDRSALEIYGEASLGQVIARLPGVRLLQRNVFNQSYLGVRGFSVNDNDKHVLILMDGVPVRVNSNGGSNRLLYESFPVAALERIELIQGQAATVYGSNAITAVINLVTRANDRTSIEYQDGEAQGYTGQKFQLGETQLDLTVQRQRAFSHWDQNGVINIRPLQGNLSSRGDSVLARFHHEQIDGQILLMDGKSTSMSTLFAAAPNNEVNDRTIITRLGSEQQLALANPLIWRWDLAFDRTDISYGTFDGHSRDIQAISSLQGNLSGNSHWLVGLSLDAADGVLQPLLPDWSTQERTIFAQLSYDWSTQLEFSAGFNWQSIRDGISNLTPQLSMVWKPADAWRFKLLYGKSFRNADPRERFSKTISQTGDPQLHPEQGSQWTAVVNYQHQAIQLQWSVFQQNVDQMIRLVRPAQGPAIFMNSAEAEALGSQLNLQYQWTTHLILDFSHTQLISDKNLTEPDALTKAGLRYQPFSGVSAGVWLDYASASKEPRLNLPVTAQNPASSEGLVASLNLNFMLDQWTQLLPSGSRLSLSLNNVSNYSGWQPSGSAAVNTIPWNSDRHWALGFSMPTPF